MYLNFNLTSSLLCIYYNIFLLVCQYLFSKKLKLLGASSKGFEPFTHVALPSHLISALLEKGGVSLCLVP